MFINNIIYFIGMAISIALIIISLYIFYRKDWEIAFTILSILAFILTVFSWITVILYVIVILGIVIHKSKLDLKILVFLENCKLTKFIKNSLDKLYNWLFDE